MRPIVCLLIILPLMLLPAGCGTTPVQPAVPAETESFAEAPPSTAPVTAAVTETTEAPIVTEETHDDLPYLQKVERPDQSVYGGPGYDYGFAGTVRERGTYTIVEEAVDPEGNLWGRLKSGIGWVDLTQIRSETYLISAGYADEAGSLPGAYQHFSASAEYAVPIVIRAYGCLRDVTIFTVEYNAEGPFPGADLFTLAEMTEQQPLVAELAFPGDMTMYGIRFTDEAGMPHVYTLYISGRNGALMLTEESLT